MIRDFRYSCLAVLGVVVAAGGLTNEAFAIKQFADEFKAMYVKDGTPLAAAVEEAKCNVCHMGASKKERNAYGEALADLLDKKEDAKNMEKIRQALETVAGMKSADGGPTFGELIKMGKLPGGPAE